MVEPVDPFECGIFHGIEVAPRATSVDDLGFEQAIDRLCQWAVGLQERRGPAKAIVAIANKNTRIIFAMLRQNTEFRAA